MTPSESALHLFKGRHFEREVIVLCVRWYLSYKLSSRDLVEMMSERGLALAHTTILRWVQGYVPVLKRSGVITRDRWAGRGAVTRRI